MIKTPPFSRVWGSTAIVMSLLAYHLTEGKKYERTPYHDWAKEQGFFSNYVAQAYGVGVMKKFKSTAGRTRQIATQALCWFAGLASMEHFYGTPVMVLAFLFAAWIRMSVRTLEEEVENPQGSELRGYRAYCCGSHLYWQLLGAGLMTLAANTSHTKSLLGVALAFYVGLGIYDHQAPEYKRANERNKYFPVLWHASAFLMGVVWSGLMALAPRAQICK